MTKQASGALPAGQATAVETVPVSPLRDGILSAVNGLGLGRSNEWYTPPEVFDALGCMFDMDVAAPMLLPSWIGDRLVCKTPSGGRNWLWKDSLETPWEGFIWMNPPFGGRNGLAQWLDKFFAHGNGIALTPDRTSAPWFHDAWHRANAVLFCRKTPFLLKDGKKAGSPAFGTALWAAGDLGVSALRNAAGKNFGLLCFPTQAIEARRAETETGSVHDGPVGPADAPKPQGDHHDR